MKEATEEEKAEFQKKMELKRLRKKWEAERQDLFVKVRYKYGKRRYGEPQRSNNVIPTKEGANRIFLVFFWMGIFPLILGLEQLLHPKGNPEFGQSLTLFGLAFIGLGLLMALNTRDKAGRYKVKKREYEQRKKEIEQGF